MPFVLDASVVACWLFDDEEHPHATEALLRVGGTGRVSQVCGGSRFATRYW